MATIGELRKRSGLIIAIVGFAILAFVLSDLFRSNQALFREDQSNAVGVVGDKKISFRQFRERINNARQSYLQQRGVEEVDDQTLSRLQDQAWDRLVFDLIFEEEKEALNLRVTGDELYSMVQGENPHPSVRQAFTNPQTGEFNKQNLRRFLQSINQGPPQQASQQQIQQFQQQKEQWLDFEKSLVEQRMQEKYFNLIEKSFYVTNLEAQKAYHRQNANASFDYVAQRIKDVKEEEIEVTEDEMREYYNQNKSKFKRKKPSRSVEYVVFNVKPTRADSQMVKEDLMEIKDEFAKTKNDSSYVTLKSDESYDSTYQGPGSLSEQLLDSVVNAEKGQVFGPYFKEGAYNLAKLIDTKKGDVTYYNARHILIKEENAEDPEEKAQSLKEQIEGGADFAELAREQSDGPSGREGGDLGWFKEGDMVEEFDNALAEHEKGELFTVNTKFGTHLVEMTAEPTNKQYKIGKIVREIYPGDQTYEEVYERASKFRGKINDPKSFAKEARKQNLNRRVVDDLSPGQKEIPGLSKGSKLVQWAYQNNEGKLSGILELDRHYVIAYLKNVKKKGVKPFKDVKEEIERKVLEKQKLDHLVNKFKETAQNKNNLKAVAKALNSKVSSASNVTLESPNVSNLGQDPILVGRVFGLKEGGTTQPFKGNKGAYQAKLNNLDEVDYPEKLTSTKENLLSDYTGRAQNETREALKEMVSVEDHRYRFY